MHNMIFMEKTIFTPIVFQCCDFGVCDIVTCIEDSDISTHNNIPFNILCNRTITSHKNQKY